MAFAALALALVAVTSAQGRPDFSGRWRVSQAKSTAGAIGNGAKVTFSSELIVKQSAGELNVEMRFPRTDPLMATVYKLDGSEVTVPTPAGITEKARAAWDGEKIVITARRVVSTAFGEFTTDTKEVWSLTPNTLTIAKTQTSEGLSDTETAVFDKDQSS